MSSLGTSASSPPPSNDLGWRRYAGRARFLAVAYFLVLATATHLPSVSTGGFSVSDKFMHFGAYLGLTLLCLAGTHLTIGRLEPKHCFAMWLAGTLYGIIDELLQVPVGRDCDVHDWIADVLGLVCGIVLYQGCRALVRRIFWRAAPVTPGAGA